MKNHVKSHRLTLHSNRFASAIDHVMQQGNISIDIDNLLFHLFSSLDYTLRAARQVFNLTVRRMVLLLMGTSRTASIGVLVR